MYPNTKICPNTSLLVISNSEFVRWPDESPNIGEGVILLHHHENQSNMIHA
jgi:hypothetical protein